MGADCFAIGLKHLVEEGAGVVGRADERHVEGFGLRVLPQQVLCQLYYLGLVPSHLRLAYFVAGEWAKKIPAG